jgi:predicted acyltransferase
MAAGEAIVKESHPEGAGVTLSKTASPAAERLVSLDTFRGFIMFWIIGGDACMAALAAWLYNPVTTLLAYETHHTPWIGLRFYDCIWPSFMLMAGVSIPFSYAKRSLTQSDRDFRLHALARAGVLFLLGSIRESVYLGSPYLIELSSALQPIAIAYFVAVMLRRKSVRVQALIAALILAGYAFLLAFVPAPGIPAGTYVLNHNLVNAVDLHFLRPHWDRWPYAKEGWGTILSTIPTISTTLIGLIIGEWLRSDRPKQKKAQMIGGVGILLLVLGYGLSPVIPIEMKMWTTTYGLASAGWACLMFLFFYSFVDIRGHRKWTILFVPIGMNPVFIYMITSILPIPEIVGVFTKGTAGHLGTAGPVLNTFAVLVVEWAILFWMYKRKIFLRA